jgi:hypothetical protein
MTRDIRKRIQKLESQIPPQPNKQDEAIQYLHRLLFFSIAHYLGNPTEDEAAFSAYGRALGYASSFELREAMLANDPDFRERNAVARRQLLAKFGVSLDDNRDALLEAFERMERGFSESYKRRFSRS